MWAMMATAPAFGEHLIEGLYDQALLLADQARAAFDLRDEASPSNTPDAVRIALSIEGLRTTTRVMHVLAWLLNQRAYQAGELSLLQLRRHGRLGAERLSDRDNLARLEPATRSLIEDSENLYARIARLAAEQDAGAAPGETPDGVRAMQGRIAAAYAGH